MKISLHYQDRHFFHPSPTPKMLRAIKAILNKFNWQIDMPVDKLTRKEAKELVGKGVQAAKRKKVRIFDTEIDEVNKELSYAK